MKVINGHVGEDDGLPTKASDHLRRDLRQVERNDSATTQTVEPAN
jgi:hypothetical protein